MSSSPSSRFNPPPYPNPDGRYDMSFPCPDDDHIRQVYAPSNEEAEKKKSKKKRSKKEGEGGVVTHVPIRVESPGGNYDPPGYWGGRRVGGGGGGGGQYSSLFDPASSNLPSAHFQFGGEAQPRSPGADSERRRIFFL